MSLILGNSRKHTGLTDKMEEEFETEEAPKSKTKVTFYRQSSGGDAMPLRTRESRQNYNVTTFISPPKVDKYLLKYRKY